MIRDINPNFQNMTVAAKTTTDYMTNPVTGTISGSSNYTMPNGGAGGGVGNSRFMHAMNEATLDAKHVVHCSLNEGLDVFWPFGRSILEQIYKVYKQKELLEDAILIYRVSRAPERRVFKIDVGQLQGQRAMQYVERVKNEIYQRRLPNRTGGGTSIIDSAYNPISITEDFFLATNSEQRGTTIDTLNAGENLGTIDDLKYFNNKLMRGLGIPSSYLPTGPDDGTAVFNDGKVGTAFIQEYRFNKYCQRLQNSIAPTLDMEFKLFLKFRGIEVHSSLFELAFNVPQSFSQYRNMSLDTERVNLFSSAMNSDARAYMSKRYALKRYMGWTEEDILENERMWKEENSAKVKDKTGTSPVEDQSVGLGSIGIRPSPEPEFGLGGPEAGPEAPLEAPPAEAPAPAPGGETPPTETP